MEKICKNCEYWNEKENSTGECELQPIVQDYNSAEDAFDKEQYKITKAKHSCPDFEPQYI